jgi:hypothetical protein
MLRLVTTLLLCFPMLFPAKAQFSDSVHYHAALSVAGNINTTDKGQNMLFNNGVRLGIRQPCFELNNNTTWVYGLQQELLTNNDFNSTTDFNRFIWKHRLNGWGLANYNSSYSLKIINQYQAGAGLAYAFLDTKKMKFKVSDGLLLEHADILVSDTVRETYDTWRNSLRITGSFAFGSIGNISYSGFWQPSLQDGSDYIIRTAVSASVKLKKWLSFTAAFNYNRFNRTGKENALFTYGVTLENYF